MKSYSIARDKNSTFSVLELMVRTRMRKFSLIFTSLDFLLNKKLWRGLSWTKNGNWRGSFTFLFVWGGENKFGNCWWCQHALTCFYFCNKNTENPRAHSSFATKAEMQEVQPSFPLCSTLSMELGWNNSKNSEKMKNPERKKRGKNRWTQSCLNEGTHLILTMEIQYFK